MSRNYRLIVAPRKFDVLKTNIFPRSEASRANMLVLNILPLFTENTESLNMEMRVYGQWNIFHLTYSETSARN